MKLKTVFALLILALGLNLGANAQVKIGYTNIELVLAYMPEAKTMEKELEIYTRKLSDKLKKKDEYVKLKYQEYLQRKEQGAGEAELKQREEELLKLDAEIQKMAADSEYDILAKRQELLTPILEKLQAAIDKVAEANGYTYIMNQTTSAGVSTILYGPDEADVTEQLFEALGIALPEQ